MTPDLDRYMAEKVMGWQLHKNIAGILDCWCEFDEEGHGGWKIKFLKQDWHPTQSIDQAFQCVEKMRERGFSVKFGDNVPPPIWYCEFWKYESDRLIEGRAFDPDPSTAICKAIHAALKEANP